MEYYYVVGGDQAGHHVDDVVVFMEKGWNGRSGPMPSNHHNHETMEFMEIEVWRKMIIFTERKEFSRSECVGSSGHWMIVWIFVVFEFMDESEGHGPTHCILPTPFGRTD